MSKESIKLINKIYKGFIISMSLALAVVAIFKNPGHLFTAGLIFALGIIARSSVRMQPISVKHGALNKKDYDSG